MLGIRSLDRTLREIGMQIHLVHRGYDRRLGEQPFEMVRHEVADPDRAHASIDKQGLERPTSGDHAVEP